MSIDDDNYPPLANGWPTLMPKHWRTRLPLHTAGAYREISFLVCLAICEAYVALVLRQVLGARVDSSRLDLATCDLDDPRVIEHWGVLTGDYLPHSRTFADFRRLRELREEFLNGEEVITQDRASEARQIAEDLICHLSWHGAPVFAGDGIREQYRHHFGQHFE